MTKRSPIAVFFLPVITLGIYAMVWYSKTREELNAKGARIPHFILFFLPVTNIIWLWEWSKGVELVTQGRQSAATTMMLQMSLGNSGMAITQGKLNTAS